MPATEEGELSFGIVARGSSSSVIFEVYASCHSEYSAEDYLLLLSTNDADIELSRLWEWWYDTLGSPSRFDQSHMAEPYSTTERSYIRRERNCRLITWSSQRGDTDLSRSVTQLTAACRQRIGEACSSARHDR